MRPWESVPAPGGSAGGAGPERSGTLRTVGRRSARVRFVWHEEAEESADVSGARVRSCPGPARVRPAPRPPPARPPRGSMRDWEFYPISADVVPGFAAGSNPLAPRCTSNLCWLRRVAVVIARRERPRNAPLIESARRLLILVTKLALTLFLPSQMPKALPVCPQAPFLLPQPAIHATLAPITL
jgi:hypothetical protein